MSKEQYMDFINNTENVNFENTNTIINKYESSIEHYKNFKEYLAAEDENLASKNLREAGIDIYQCCEWALKNYLKKRYQEEFERNEISIYVANQLKRELNGAKFHYLINKFEKYSEPLYSELEIKTRVILDNAEVIHNDPKHNGKVTNPSICLKVISEVRKILHHYIDGEAELSIIDDSMYGEGNQWYDISEHTNDFAEWFTYILVCGAIKGEDNDGLFSIPWDMVIDFDPSSEIDGLYKKYAEETLIQPKIRTLSVIESKRKFKISATPHWVMANGTSDIPDSIKTDSMSWKAVYGRNLDDVIEEFHKVYSKPAKVFIYNIADERVLEKVVDEFNEMYGVYGGKTDVEFFVIEPKSFYERIDYENFKRINIPFVAFCNNLSECSNATKPRKMEGIALPSYSGAKKELEPSFLADLSDSFEIVYEGIENHVENEELKYAKYFYRGDNPISWFGISKGFDITREVQQKISRNLEKYLKDKATVLQIVPYEPGVGGTTMMRRLAWELCAKYPTLIMNSYSAEETGSSVQKLYDVTHLPALIFVDSNNVEIEEAKALQVDLKKLGFSFVICYFQRKTSYSKQRVATNIIGSLNRQESLSMVDNLREYVCDSSTINNLMDICENGDSMDRTPFILSMYAFSDEFRGTKPYIERYLRKVSKPIEKILFALALVDFGNVPLPIEYFRNKYEGSRVSEFYNEVLRDIKELVRIEKVGGTDYIKIRYHQFGKEILRQMSLGADATGISFTNLIDNILEFIEDSRNKSVGYFKEEVDVMRNLFITRTADFDSQKPDFSTLIEKLREESRTSGTAYDDSGDVIERIFNKLAEVYPEEPHFAAHLARYYFYIEKNYEKGFKYIDTAIDLSSQTGEEIDPLLLHMKAMGYSSIITNSLIRDVNNASDIGDTKMIKEKIEEIEETAENAFALFEEVRKSNIGVAGHISDVMLCISIASAAKNLIEETEYMKFVSSEDGEWAVKYIDRATVLWDECKGLADDPSSPEMQRIENYLRTVTEGLQTSIDLWEEYLSNNGQNKIRVRRVLAQAYNKKLKHSSDNDDNQRQIERIVELMESNMIEEPDNPANIRYWFEAIMRMRVDDPDKLVRDAISKLNRWVALTDSIEPHFYRFILKFLQAQQGSTRAQEDAKGLLRELKARASNEYNRTSMRYWLMNTGEGVASLMPNAQFWREHESNEESVSSLKQLTGRISNYYVNDGHAYINWRGLDVFFNPSSTKGEITKNNINQRVKFGVGFSYDGPRAFNNSIHLLEADDKETPTIQLKPGVVVKCEVIRHLEYFVRVKILGAEEENASIYINELKSPYSSENRPSLGSILDVQVIQEGYDQKRDKPIWELTMYINGETEDEDTGESAFALAFKKAKRNTENNN